MALRSVGDLTGRVAIVTGANSGIGKETVVGLAERGATVVLCARDPERGRVALHEVRERTKSERVELAELDLASFASIRRFASEVLERHERIHVLVNNAGLVTDGRQQTADGFELMMGVNHLGHFLLTDLLRERLVASAPARVVVVSSVAHRFVPRGIDRDDLMHERDFTGFATYCQTKLANVLFARELARRLAGTAVTVNAVHPGSVRSQFSRDGDTRTLAAWYFVGRLLLRSARGGAKTSILLAGSDAPRITRSTGRYFSHGRPWPPSRAARSDEAARWLWEESERLVASVPS